MNVRNPKLTPGTISPNMPFGSTHTLKSKQLPIRRSKHNNTALINHLFKLNPNTYTNFEQPIYEDPSYSSSYTNMENLQKLAIAYFKKSHRTYHENQILISYLFHLSPFNQLISESAGKEGEDIIRTLSFSLKYEFMKQNTLVFKYGDLCDKFYLILKGQVDMIVPNEEDVQLNEFEYYDYLLKLREYKEMILLNKVISKNTSTFCLSENNFDIWVKKAYNTIKVLRYGVRLKALRNNNIHNIHIERKKTPPHRRRESFTKPFDISIDKQLKSNKNRRQSMMNMTTTSYTFIEDFSRIKNTQDNDNNNNEPEEIYHIFDSLALRNIALKLENQILRTANIIDPRLKKEQDRFPYFDTIDFEKISSEANNITPDTYINRIKPIIIPSDKLVKKPVTIFKYFIANSLKTGDTFGEMISDLNQSNSSNQRVISVITNENCHFGTLTKTAYNKCLKEVSEKTRKAKLNFFFKLDLFQTCDHNLFMNCFYNLFTKRTMTNTQILFNQHDSTDNSNRSIYFIRDGEFSSTCNISINEINRLLLKLRYKNLINLEDDIETESYKQKKINSIVIDEQRQELYDTKKKVRLLFFKENDVIGMDDSLYKDKYLYECKCTSTYATIYELPINYFKMILSMDHRIKKRVKVQEAIKRNLMVKLLLKFKITRIEVFNYYDKKEKCNTKNENLRKERQKERISSPKQYKTININESNNNSIKTPRYRKTIISKAISDSFKLLKKKEKSFYQSNRTLSPQSLLLSGTNVLDSTLLKSKYENTITSARSARSRAISSYREEQKCPYVKISFPSLKKNPPIKKKIHSHKKLIHHKENNINNISKTNNNRSRNKNVWPLYATTQSYKLKDNSDEDEEVKEIKNYERYTINNNNNKLLLPCKPSTYLSSKKTKMLLNTLPGFFQTNNNNKPISILNINNKKMFMSPCKTEYQ